MIEVFYGVYVVSEKHGSERVRGHTDLGELRITFDNTERSLLSDEFEVKVMREEWEGQTLKKAEPFPMQSSRRRFHV